MPGSVIAMAVIISPLQNRGSQRCFCSSFVSSFRYGAMTSLCSVKPSPLVPARATSSVTIHWKRRSGVPPPPYDSGMSMASRPVLPAASQMSRLT